MDDWYTLAKVRQQELDDWADQRRLAKQALSGREKRQPFRQTMLWIAERMIATGQRLEQRYRECCSQELEMVMLKPGR